MVINPDECVIGRDHVCKHVEHRTDRATGRRIGFDPRVNEWGPCATVVASGGKWSAPQVGLLCRRPEHPTPTSDGNKPGAFWRCDGNP
jgi:hypothetical protein